MTLVVDAMGVTLSLQAEDPAITAALARVLRDLTTETVAVATDRPIAISGRGPWQVVGPETSRDADSMPQALSAALTAVNLAAVRHTSLLALHAAVLTRRGRTLVVPARSGAGKSTLAACLLRQGWAYVSDEALALDRTSGRLVSYPRPLGLSEWSCHAVGDPAGTPGDGETVVTASDLGAVVDRSPGPVRHVVVLERTGDGSRPSTTRIERSEALGELLQRGFTFHHDAASALRMTVEVLRSAQTLRLRLGDPWVAAEHLTAVVDAA